MKNKQTITSLIERSIELHPESPALSFAFKKPMTYAELGEQISLLASFLLSQGLQKNDTVAILAENSPNWGVAYLAIARCGAIIVPILPDFPEADVRHIIKNVKARFLFTTQRQVEKIYELDSYKIARIFSLDNSELEHVDNSLKFSDILLQARDLGDGSRATLDDVEIDENDVLAIIYTSGTFGHSKAVQLSHKNIYANVNSSKSLFQIDSSWSFLSILPISHTYEFTVGFILPLSHGARIIYAGRAPTPTILEKICREEQPSVMCVVPMVMEKIYKKKVMTVINNSAFLKYAVKIGWFRKKLMRKIGSKLLDFFGGRLQVLAIGGAAINFETEKFLKEAGFPYLVGYGLTETSPILAGGPFGDRTITIGSVGKVLPDVEVKIGPSSQQDGIGEIFARGPNIMLGYFNDNEANQEVFSGNGWLATGDLGYFDEFNNLHIKGRSKSVIVLAHGENIYPEAIEDKINSFVQVVESVVVENSGRIEAQVYLDYDLVDKETARGQENKRLYIAQVLQEIKEGVNGQLPAYSKLSKIIERQEPFVKTATHKIKRYLCT